MTLKLLLSTAPPAMLPGSPPIPLNKLNPSSHAFSSNHTTPLTYTLFSLTPCCLTYHSCHAGPLIAPLISSRSGPHCSTVPETTGNLCTKYTILSTTFLLKCSLQAPPKDHIVSKQSVAHVCVLVFLQCIYPQEKKIIYIAGAQSLAEVAAFVFHVLGFFSLIFAWWTCQ